MFQKEIKALQLCATSDVKNCEKCPYKGNDCVVKLMKTCRNIIRLFDDKINRGRVRMD